MKMLVVALGLAGLLAAPVLAAEMNFAVVDADGSGLVSIEEATAAGWEWTEEQFAAADSDGDGYLNVEEFAAAAAKG
jgi:Ca2+-binding EF-hand superfamily protein